VHVLRFIRDNLKMVIWVASATVVIFVVVVVANRIHSYRSDRAVIALFEAKKMSEGSSEQQSALKEVAQDYGSTAAGQEAMIYLGNQLLKKNDFAGALEQFENLAEKVRGSELLHVAALHRVAATKRAMGNIEDAAKTYLMAASDPKNLEMADSLFQAARCYEELKQYDEAAKLYRRVIDSTNERDAKLQSEERLLWLIANNSISG